MRGAAGLSADHAERLRDLAARRETKAASIVEELSEGDCRQLLTEIARKMPSVILEIISRRRDSPPSSPSTGSAPEWCYCTRCREMPSDMEKMCCGNTKDKCISILPVSIQKHLFIIIEKYNCFKIQLYNVNITDKICMRYNY